MRGSSIFIPAALSALAAVSAPTPSRAAGTLAVGGYHACATLPNGHVKCWGSNNTGQVGDGTYQNNRPTPVLVKKVFEPFDIAAGRFHTCAVFSGSRTKCWGNNQFGQLGNGTTTRQIIATGVRGQVGDFVLIAAGNQNTCAKRGGDGAVYCWGDGSRGQIGDGHFRDRLKPRQIVEDLSVRQIAVGGLGVSGDGHACLETSRGVVKCWGANSQGQVGDGTTTNSALPLRVLDDTLLFARLPGVLAAGGIHTCAVTKRQRLMCWGDNSQGQLGVGTFTDHLGPVLVKGIRRFLVWSVAAGDLFTCAVVGDAHRVVCWGQNSDGQLGDGTTTIRNVPVFVQGLSNVTEIGAGARHACARLANRRVKCWGDNSSGQLGNGTMADSHTPVGVIGVR